MSSMKDLLADRPYQLPDPPKSVAFDGETYSPELDHGRLSSQRERTFKLMRDGHWRTLEEIHEVVRGSESALSARLRDFRKEQYDGHSVKCRRRGGVGPFEYQLTVKA